MLESLLVCFLHTGMEVKAYIRWDNEYERLLGCGRSPSM